MTELPVMEMSKIKQCDDYNMQQLLDMMATAETKTEYAKYEKLLKKISKETFKMRPVKWEKSWDYEG